MITSKKYVKKKNNNMSKYDMTEMMTKFKSGDLKSKL